MAKSKYYAEIRKDHLTDNLNKSNLNANPIKQTDIWLREAIACGESLANSMTLATAGEDGKVHSRIVLVKEIKNDGIYFFTNYNSNKAKEIQQNNNVSLLFWWPKLERQISIEGQAFKISSKDSDAYFKTRPRLSQIGAWVSMQSSRISSRNILDDMMVEKTKEFEGREVNRPDYWGGYVVIPERIEFWQGRANRLHDRICFSKNQNKWNIDRLAP